MMKRNSKQEQKITFLPKPIELPLFLFTRVQIQRQHLEAVRKYIGRKSSIYTKPCGEESAIRRTDYKMFLRYASLKYDSPAVCGSRRRLRLQRDLVSTKAWHLPPNIYSLHEPFLQWKGDFGSHWEKRHTHLPPPKATKGAWKFYISQNRYDQCNRYKGIFLSNARKRRATTRCMVSNPMTCYRDTTDPAPNHYNLTHHLLSSHVSPIVVSKVPNPHIFLPHCSVPATPNSIHRRNISFLPGPGRYDTRYGRSCPCNKRRKYLPGVQLLIDIEKRKKFRQLPYTKIKARLYCSPEWRHVTGHGHRYLFKNVRRMKLHLKVPQDGKKERIYKLYPDARYINMITNPTRDLFTFRDESLEMGPSVAYNCLQKRAMRRHLQSNKKIAFNSGQDRFNDIARAPILTISQLQKVIDKLPPDRRLQDYPVMKVDPSEIKSRLYETPPHMQPAYELELRKKHFKFLPLPKPKVLVAETEISTVGKSKTFFASKVDASMYFKDNI